MKAIKTWKSQGGIRGLFECPRCGRHIEMKFSVGNNYKTCGCLRRDKDSAIGNNKYYKRLYSVWVGMHRRCYSVKTKGYERYGGRGIIVCDKWLHSFKNFYQWSIDNGYKEGLTIDRIDNDGNYEPNNCRWKSMKLNMRCM